MMFKSVSIENEEMPIPVYKSDVFYYIKWADEETPADMIENNGGCIWGEFKVYPEDAEEYDGFLVEVYEITCCKTACTFYLLILGGLDESESIYHSVALDYNQFNLLEFYRDVMLPFSGKSYTHRSLSSFFSFVSSKYSIVF